MFSKVKRRFILITAISLAFFSLSASAGYAFSDSPRVYPKNSVTILENGVPAGEFSREFPLPSGKVLQANGPCAVKMQSVVLGVSDQTRFSVLKGLDGYTIEVEEGLTFFSISEPTCSIAFKTPAETVTLEQVALQTPTENNIVRGLIQSQDGVCKIGVLNGGSIRLATVSGPRTILPDQFVEFAAQSQGNNIVAGLYDWLESIGVKLGATAGNTAVATGAAAVGLGATTAGLIISKAAEDDDKDASPSEP